MDTDIMQDLCLNLVLLGRTGVGKSSSGNTILGREAFISKKSSTLVTHSVAAEVSQVSGLPITVYDTPGFSDTELSKEDLWKYEEILHKCESGLCAFLLVLRADRFTKEDQEVLEKIEELLGAKRIQNTWILFTRGDELEEENKTIDKVIKETEYLKNLSQKFEGRQHVLDNKHIRRRDGQVNSLISKVFYRNLENLSRRQRIPVKIQEIPVERRFTRRIVLLGKSGVGKSAAANTILGQKVFKSTVGSNSVTRECSVKHANISDKKVSVVDTPGFFDTHMSPEQLMVEIVRSVYISSPGPHAFLIVFPVNRFTQQEEEIPQIIEMLFGEDVLKYSIILFTHGDQLEGKTIETMINENSRLRDLVDQCGGRFHVFNNRDESNREQVNDLLQKIDTMIEQNGGGHYSNQMFEDAQRFRQEEEIERVRKETEEKIRAEIQHENNLRQEEGENQRQEEVEILVKQTKQTIRAEIQRENNARKQQEEIQRREEIERVRRHTEQRVRAKIQHEINVSQHDEKKKRQEEIERVRRQTEERIRAEIQHESNVRQQQEEIQRREEIERVRAECEAQMMSELERLRAVRKRKEEKRKQQDNQRQEEIERVRRQTEERRAEIERENNVRKQQEEIQKREEIERVRRQTERRIKAECKAQMMPEIERLRTERQRDREKIKQQDNQRREEIERVRRQTEERVRAEIERENNVRKQQEKKQNTQYIEKRSGFNKFFSKFWKYFLMGIVAGTIIGGGNSDGIVNGIVVLIVDKRQGNQ